MKSRKLGVMLVNLGTPEEPTPKAVRKFLKEFLSDKRVVDLPRIIWLPVLYGIILTFRPKKVAENYQAIWTEEGSPLLNFSKQQQKQLQLSLDSSLTDYESKVCIAMTYGNPSIKDKVDELNQWGADKIIVLPLYPQYSTTTTAPIEDQLTKFTDFFDKSDNIFIDKYHVDSDYIDALANSIKDSKVDINAIDKLVISFHGIPKRYVVSKGDPYQQQCEETAQALAKKLKLADDQWLLAYQSRLGKEEWLTPYLDKTIEALPSQEVKNIAVICPGFSVDCLETLEEVAMQNKELFLSNGGEQFQYIPALNSSSNHIQMMKNIVLQSL
ncbi:MAG: ferrochelatase [Gammaproteobacteria bacterium]|nr:ferrochelatase [Gammaproteobacteria bacterium]